MWRPTAARCGRRRLEKPLLRRVNRRCCIRVVRLNRSTKLVLIFAGSTFLWSLLREHPLVFLVYWAGCAWITLLAVLLAFYDMVKVRADVRRERRRLERELLEREHLAKAENEKPHDPHPR